MNLNISEEDGVYGTGQDEVSNWFCAGKIVGNKVSFRKYYRGNYHVDYDGELTHNVGEMPIQKGTWKIESDECDSGDFVIYKRIE